MLDVFSSNFLWFEAVICNNDFYVAIVLSDAVHQHPQLFIAQESLCGDGDLRVDIWQKQTKRKAGLYVTV